MQSGGISKQVQESAYIHEKGVLRRDVGCHNLLLDENDNIKLYDFGGSSIDSSKPLCGPGTGFQRLTEDEDRISVTDELFALSSTTYEIWTSRKPYQDDSQSERDHYKTVPDHFRNEQFPDLTSVLPASIIMKCWHGHYASAIEVVKDLETLHKTRKHFPGPTRQTALHSARFYC